MDLKETPKEIFVRHPWEQARYRFFRRVLRDSEIDSRPLTILDVGAGDAWFSSQLVPSLPEGSRATCWDIGYEGDKLPTAFEDRRLEAAKRRPDRTFDLILLLDVAEHVEDDRGFLAEIVKDNMKRGSRLLFSVPAWQSLFTGHDVALGHHRRYAPSEGRHLLERNGLTVLQAGGLFHSLTAARAASALKEKLMGRPAKPQAGSLEWRSGAALGSAISAILAADGTVSKMAANVGMELPGLSWWALCNK